MIRAVALLLAMCLATSAMATPPRVTTSEDRIVAATQTHLYVVRDILDNTGSHYAALHDQHLIEIDLDTGEATQFWPLRRVYYSNLETDDFLVPGKVTERDGETHDMIAILQDVGAEPMIPSVWAANDLTLQNGALMREEAQLATPFAMRAAARAQLGILRQAYPPITNEEDYMRAEQLDFYDLYAPGDWECALRAEGVTLFRAADRVLVAKLYCEDVELIGGWSFHMLIKEQL